ncbi:hypothetical protein [Serratia inhibens]
MLNITSGPATIVDPSYIEYLEQPPGIIQGTKTIQINDDHRLHLSGEFGGFRIYLLVNHTRAEVIPETVRQVSRTHFIATVKLELFPNKITEHEIHFRAPVTSFSGVRARRYGLFPDSFEFKVNSPKTETYPCSLHFLQHFAENCPLIPLNIQYIGITKSENREAHHRLEKGHEKLQKLLSEQNRRPSKQTTSIVLYRPSDLKDSSISFSDLIEIFEASMISYFQPRPLNISRLNFPNDSPDLCKKIKSLNVQNVMTTITAPKGTKLFSNTIKMDKEHTTIIEIK